jgi:hypothetical protein
VPEPAVKVVPPELGGRWRYVPRPVFGRPDRSARSGVGAPQLTCPSGSGTLTLSPFLGGDVRRSLLRCGRVRIRYACLHDPRLGSVPTGQPDAMGRSFPAPALADQASPRKGVRDGQTTNGKKR